LKRNERKGTVKLTHRNRLNIIVSIVAISFIQGLQFGVSPILGQIGAHFSQIDRSFIQMLITAPALLSMIVALLSGSLVMIICKKKLLVFAGFVAGVSGFLPFLADSFWLLFVSRLIYGIGLGLACTLNTAVVAEFFEGDERVSVMGIQAASVGAGMVLISTIGGKLGTFGFQYSYYLHIIGFVSMFVIALLLPDTGVVKAGNVKKIKLNKHVFITSFFGLLELLFLITFTTNIAMHMGGSLSGNSSQAGILNGIFSGVQIVMGIILGLISKLTGKFSLPVAMLCFSVGGILLITFPSNYGILMIAAVFCGASQGLFVPQAMVDVANAVETPATAMAAAFLTCLMCIGQVISPIILNFTAGFVFGEVSTINVYKIAVIGMSISAVALAIYKNIDKTWRNNN
jgi:predicted MFS family arabinose efflux permease